MVRWRKEAVLNLYNLALGAFLVVSPWLFAMTRESARVDSWASGALLVAVSLAAVVAFADWEEWVSLALGLWMIAAPWLLGFAHTPAMHANVAVGCAVVFLALLDIWLVKYEDAPETSGTPAAR
jgi:hypothetical protein